MKLKNNKIAYIYLTPKVERDKLNPIISKLKETNNGFAGYRAKKYLKERLNGSVFDISASKVVELAIDEKGIFNIVEKALKAIEKKLSTQSDLEIYIFPTLDEFVKESMDGINGTTPYPNVFHLYIHTDAEKSKTFEKALSYTVAHEYNHAIRSVYFPSVEILMDELVLEGLAENFREDVLGGKPAKWARALSALEAKKVFNRFGDLLFSDKYSLKDYREIFFGSNKYAMWTGYSIGYFLVKDFLKKLGTKRDWNQIIQTPSKEIAEKAGWLK